MSREIDWKVHELMGNDMTGWEWLDTHEDNNAAVLYDANRNWLKGVRIPHYSTTGDGMLLVMEWINNTDDMTCMITVWSNKSYRANVSGCSVFYDNAPMALAKAFISAMEDRDNG